MASTLWPASKGWIRASMTLTSSEPIATIFVKNMVTGGKPDDHEFAFIEQRGKHLKVVYRKLPEVAKREELAIMTPLCRELSRKLSWLGMQVTWHETTNNFYSIEAWADGAKLATKLIHRTHIHDLTMVTDDIVEFVEVAIKEARQPAEPILINDNAAPTA